MSHRQPALALAITGAVLRLPGPIGRLGLSLGRLLVASSAEAVRADANVDLVRRAASGDHDAFEALIAPRAMRLIATARKILRDPDAADDAAQSALVSAWRMLPRLRDPARFDAWLAKLLVNACYGEVRRQRRFASRVEQLEVEPSVEDGSEDRADRDALDAAFHALTPEHRAILVLRHYADLPLADVAEIVGVPHGTARSRLHYAIRALRAALDAVERPQVEEVRR
jgi:RNA polymerase sigma-70 factor (ECF subfamily)